VRRNPNVTYIVMDNQTYGLTKGQSSPTSQAGYVTGTSPGGNPDAPLNGLAVALAAGGTFLARGFSAHPKLLVDLLKQALDHDGFSIVEVMSPCVTYNKINTYAWFKENVFYVDERPEYDAADRGQAFELLMKSEKIPLGVLFKESRATFETLTHLPERPLTSLAIETLPSGLEQIQNAYV
jgi:2-oxoglutarate ferredoxin oxidoreductase subunit beta